jgi:hypothetical protein
MALTATGSVSVYSVMYRGEPIGRSKLKGRDRGMVVAHGDFEPLPTYDAVHSVFLLFIQAVDEGSGRAQGAQGADEQKLARRYQERDALQLTLQDADGRVIQTSWIHIDDYGDLGREVSAQISDARCWDESASSEQYWRR